MSPETLRYRVGLIKAQIERKAARGLILTADDIWGRIKKAFPTAPEADQEAIFQAVG